MGTPVTDYNTATEVFLASFHSINVPSEWGLAPVAPAPVATLPVESFHSINVPSEWGLKLLKFGVKVSLYDCFHSINVPSEWGQMAYCT